MQIVQQQACAVAAALVMVVVCLSTGCGTTSSPRAFGTRHVTPAMPETSPALAIDAKSQRMAEAVAHFAAGVSYDLTGDQNAALPEYQKSFELDPQNTQAASRLGQIYLNRRDLTNAVAVLEQSTRVNPGAADVWFLLGYVYRAADQNPKAIPALQQALQLDPTHLPTIRVLLDTYAQEDTATNLVAVVKQATAQKSKDTGYWAGLGDALVGLIHQKPSLAGEIDRAYIRQCYENALALAPGDLDILARVADTYADSGEFKLAADAYEKLLKARPDNPQLLDRLWRAYVRSDQKERAIATLDEVIKRDPLRFDVYNRLGDLYEEIDKPGRAIASYQQSLVLNPNQLELYMRVALAQMRLKKFDDAAMTLTSAKEKFPTKYQIPYLFGLLQSEQKHFTNALVSFADAEALAKVDPEEVKPTTAFYFAYGSACERAGDTEKAARLFTKAIEIDPKNHNACNYLGYMWADKGVHLEEALALIERAVKLDPDNSAYLDSLGWVLFKLGRVEEALPHLRRAIELMQKEAAPEDATVLDHLVDVLLKLGKRDEAIEFLRRAVKLDPGNKVLAEKLQQHTATPISTAAPPESPAK